jgi:hypothetical protein
MEPDSYWRTRTISEAQAQDYSQLRATCSGCVRITDIPWKLLLRQPRTSGDPFLGNLPLPEPPVSRQTILPTIVPMSAAEKARNDSVRMLPSALRLRLSAMAENSSGASTIVTTSYRPCVHN